MSKGCEICGIGPVIIDNPSLGEVCTHITSFIASSSEVGRTINPEQGLGDDTGVEKVEVSLRGHFCWNDDRPILVLQRPL